MFKKRLRRLENLVKQAETPAKPVPRTLQSAQDVMDLLQEQVEALRTARWCGALPKARALGYLAGIARKAIETELLAQRLESGKVGQARPGAAPLTPSYKVYMGFDPRSVVKAEPSTVPTIDPSAMAGFLAEMESQAELQQQADLLAQKPND
jgi:hypothetical protein